MRRPYFPRSANQPESLTYTVERRVKFEEVDPLGIVWHGRYSSYFEDARVALGEKYDIGYLDFYKNGVVTPIKKLHFDFFRPLRFNDPFTVQGIWHWAEAARINFEFIIRNEAGDITTTGYTIQMMLDLDQNILVVPPPFYLDFCERWRAGELKDL